MIQCRGRSLILFGHLAKTLLEVIEYLRVLLEISGDSLWHKPQGFSLALLKHSKE